MYDKGAVLWNLDGILINTEDLHWISWKNTLALEGIFIKYEQFRSAFGQSDESILSSWLGGGATSERIARIANAKEELYGRKMRSQGISPLPGALALLDGLCGEGWLQAGVSTAPAEILKEILGGLRTKCFQTAVSPNNVSWGRPDPEIYLTAARGIEVAPERCIVVESSPLGIEGAHRAGMKTIAIGHADKLRHADLVVASPEELDLSTFEQLLEEGRTSRFGSSAHWASSAANNSSPANSPWTNAALGN